MSALSSLTFPVWARVGRLTSSGETLPLPSVLTVSTVKILPLPCEFRRLRGEDSAFAVWFHCLAAKTVAFPCDPQAVDPRAARGPGCSSGDTNTCRLQP